MIKIIFDDAEHGTQYELFETYEQAQEYWDEYADTETCFGGVMYDIDNDEVIWEFHEN